MEWILFIFKRGGHHYLVGGEFEKDAIEKLARRQSISIERCKKEYILIKTIDNNSDIIKL